MDPTVCLQEIRDLIVKVRDYDKCYDGDIDCLCELMDALDHWMTVGGFIPDQWKKIK